jgi:hypothetical protein
MKISIAVCLMIAWIPVSGMSAEFSIPNRFESGNEIKAREFNENYEAIAAQINALRRELDALKNKTDAIPLSSAVHTRSWKLSSERGSATKWANLPTEMALAVTAGKSTLFITVGISRVQHSVANVNTEFRITIEDKRLRKTEVAKTNTGNHQGWAFDALSMHAAAAVKPGDYTVRVQYRTQKGTVLWHNDGNGSQFRRLTVLEVPASGAKTGSK